MAKIYTKTGDQGTTGLIGGKRVSKDSNNIEVIGVLDELNAYLGICVTSCHNDSLKTTLKEVQCKLFDAGAQVATPVHSPYYKKYIIPEDVIKLEKMIDEYTSQLEELKNFILPGGTPLSAHLHYARTLCRRAERKLIAFSKEQDIDSSLKIFLNRLSDWLFIVARFANKLEKVQDIPWTPTT